MSLLTDTDRQTINDYMDAWLAELVVKVGDMRRHRVELEMKNQSEEIYGKGRSKKRGG